MNKPLLNADLGEGFDGDADMFPLLDLANIACGGHVGDAQTIRRAMDQAHGLPVKLGAHPSYPDRAGFGRARPTGPLNALYSSLCTQMDLFENMAARQGLKTQHWKPHGQLYNDAAVQADVAGVVLRVAQDYPHLSLLVLAHSPLVKWAEEEGIDVVTEAFPDRVYLSSGQLCPRSEPGAVIHDLTQIVAQAHALSCGQPIQTQESTPLVLCAETLCVHGDSPQALQAARAIRMMVKSL